METKQIEIRDRGTFIPALAVRVSRADGWLIGTAGFGDEPVVILVKLCSIESQSDPYGWPNASRRTMTVAHEFVERHWDEIPHEGVVDVRRILGETDTDAPSEREYRSSRPAVTQLAAPGDQAPFYRPGNRAGRGGGGLSAGDG